MRHARLLLLMVVLASCTSPVASTAPPPPIGPMALRCDPGTRPVAGDASSCAVVGPTSIPDGFVQDDGWGFRPTLPASACAGATRAVLGSDACQPIGDCNAAFPPAAAKVGVRADGTPFPGRPDVAVTTTVDGALALAPAGSTIAIDQGQFAAPAQLTKSIDLVGRCAAQTSLVGAAFGVSVKGPVLVSIKSMSLEGAPTLPLLVNSGASVTLEGVYVHGDGNLGAEVGNASTLTVMASAFEGPQTPPRPTPTTGLEAIYDGHIVLIDSEVRHFEIGVYGQSVGSTLDLSRSVVHQQTSLQSGTEGLYTLGAFLGAKVTVEESYIESQPGRIGALGAQVAAPDATSPGNPPASMVVKSSALVQTGVPRESGSAFDVVQGATLDLDGVTVAHQCMVGLSASESAKITMNNSVVKSGPSPQNARVALATLSQGWLDVESTAIIAPTQSAIILDGNGTLALSRSLIEGVVQVQLSDYTTFMGSAQAVAASAGTTATISDSAFVDNEGTGLFSLGGTLELDRTLFAGTHASSLGRSSAAILGNGATIEIRDSEFAQNDLALGMVGGRALLLNGAVTDNTEALRLEQVTFVQTSEVVEAAVPGEAVASNTSFARNGVLLSPSSVTR